MTLAKIQQKLQSYLLKDEFKIIEEIVDTANVPASTRLSIYKNAYQSRLTEALTTSYPVLCAFLGVEKFNELVNQYISSTPSQFRSIRWYGDNFSNFLLKTATHRSYLSDLALFEWNLSLAFDSEEKSTIIVEDMNKIPILEWASMKINLHPSVRVFSSSWNVVDIWQAISDDLNPPELVNNNKISFWVIWRQEYLSHFIQITNAEKLALSLALDNQSFQDICMALIDCVPEEEIGEIAASYLKGWISAGLVSSISTDSIIV